MHVEPPSGTVNVGRAQETCDRNLRAIKDSQTHIGAQEH